MSIHLRLLYPILLELEASIVHFNEWSGTSNKFLMKPLRVDKSNIKRFLLAIKTSNRLQTLLPT